jgi:hypothetical protein
MWIISCLPGVLGILALAGWWAVRRRNMDRWLTGYLIHAPKRRDPRPEEEVHVLLCIADHFEPKGFGASPEQAAARVARWVEGYPLRFGSFRDSDGRTPRHSFFYPIEEYEPGHLDSLTWLCQSGFGEVEVHLHHHDDGADNLRRSLLGFRHCLRERHGLLGTRRETGEVVYGFIHGNWALNNSHPEGLFCGVEGELEVLRETGCYADFTLPSAPERSQTPTINSIYHVPTDDPGPRAHEGGLPAGTGIPPEKSLLLIQGPLLLDWSRRRLGILPVLENGCLQSTQPPSISRLRLWLRARVHVPTRPDWFFVKLHAHGAQEKDHEALLGGPMVEFHEQLARRAEENPRFHYHYVTAREMYNLVRAAESGWQGTVYDALDFEVLPPPFGQESAKGDSPARPGAPLFREPPLPVEGH